MDDVTRAVRAMYEQFPYPAGVPELRVASDARLLMSYVGLTRTHKRPLRALDAGCGRGLDAMGLATLQPDVQLTAIDINRVALEEARREASRRGLKNLTFREVDLMTLEGLEVPDGGFDVIYSSGVLHHLSDPARGLELLRDALAPHGVIVLMVYGRHGREGLYRMVRALDAIVPRTFPLAERLMVGRALAASGAGEATRTGSWSDAAAISDVEFVDRYLNVNETSYDVDSLWSLLDGASLQFLRWCSPDEWNVARVLPAGPLRDLALARSPRDQHRLIEQLCWRPRLELIVGHQGNGPRAPIARADFESTTLAVSPEVAFDVRTRALRGSLRTESVSYRSGAGSPVALDGALAIAALLLREQTEDFKGANLIAELTRSGLPRGAALDAIGELLARGIVYAPQT